MLSEEHREILLTARECLAKAKTWRTGRFWFDEHGCGTDDITEAVTGCAHGEVQRAAFKRGVKKHYQYLAVHLIQTVLRVSVAKLEAVNDSRWFARRRVLKLFDKALART